MSNTDLPSLPANSDPAAQVVGPSCAVADLFGWIVAHHVCVRLLILLPLVLAGLWLGGVSDSNAVKWRCFFFTVPLLALAQLDCDVWRFIFRVKPNSVVRDGPLGAVLCSNLVQPPNFNPRKQ